MKLSNQATGAIMMALQKCILEEVDITNILKDMNFQLGDNEELIVLNPPMFNMSEMQETEDFVETKQTTGSD